MLERSLRVALVLERRPEARELRRIEERVEEARLSAERIVRKLGPQAAKLFDLQPELLLVLQQPCDAQEGGIAQP